MLLMFVFACVLAHYKHYDLKVLAGAWPLYPYFIVELLYFVFQISAFAGNYSFLPLAGFLKSVYILVMLVPIIVYKLYKPALWGSGAILTGTILNKLVINANNGQMPVFPTISNLTDYYNEAILQTDTFHVLGDSSTKLWFLADYIDIGWSILSLGDIFIHSFTFIIVYCSIKQLSLQRSSYFDGIS